jgi:hypothetical protein
MAARFTASITLAREGDAGDPKGNWGPRGYSVELPGLIDQELEVKVLAGGVDVPLLIPTVGSNTQIVFIRCDVPGVTYKRNLETTVNPLGAGGIRLEAGAPAGSTTLTQLLFSNPGSVLATIYVLVAGN